MSPPIAPPSVAARDLVVAGALARAKEAARWASACPIEKTVWGSPAGKKRLAKRLAALLPPHTTYVEPFAGSAAVFFEKEPAPVEALNDADPEIAFAFRTLKGLTRKGLERLRAMPWVGSRETYKRLLDATPSDPVERLHRFLYLSHFSYGKLRGKSFNPTADGVVAKTMQRIEDFAPRLSRVHVFRGDYEPVVRRFDGRQAAHFLDPPYAGYDVHVGEGAFDEERFFALLKALKGAFLLTYGTRGKLPGLLRGEGFTVKRIQPPRSIRAMRGVGGPRVLTQLVATNYEPAHKAFEALAGDGWLVDDLPPEGPPRPRPAPATGAPLPCAPLATPAEATTSPPQGGASADESAPKGAFDKPLVVLKGARPEDERYVLGVVLEPETVDAQGDIYSADEIARAAHAFMEDFGGLGLMHRERVNGQVKILETYLAPADFELAGARVRKGTWLLAVRVLDDALWAQVKGGALTGFSIGGSARKYPESAFMPSEEPSHVQG
ncbi:MAG TPA: XkdF-like putative serine protease domain-containing protein [Polyangiaceae bacterium]|nr:XkdF-like putative serine protease domain-containing protein [Polyangiaceae bacterium]